MINKNHKELGNLLSVLVKNRCFIEVRPAKIRDMVAKVYDNEEDALLDYPRWSVVSRESYPDLIVYGDVTEDGKPIYNITAKEIISLYKKWVDEGKPEKEYTKEIKGIAEPDDINEAIVDFDDDDFDGDEDEVEISDEVRESAFGELKTGFSDPDNYFEMSKEEESK